MLLRRSFAGLVVRIPAQRNNNHLLQRLYNVSRFNGALIVEVVPALGESITEGAIAKRVKAVGDKVSIDDVVAIVETDKVTVDIKSIHSGVLTKQLATDTVIVGQPLYELDSDAEAISVTTSSPPVSASSASASPEAPIQPLSSSHSKPHRQPSIHFLGKRSKIPVHSPLPTVPATPPKTTVAAKPPTPTTEKKAAVVGNGVDFITLKDKGFFGRPRISEAEKEAIESGGATFII